VDRVLEHLLEGVEALDTVANACFCSAIMATICLIWASVR
jgi:hypothetical protein